MAQSLAEFLAQHGEFLLYFGTFAILVICGIGVPIPEEATFLAAGYAASKVAGSNVWILCVAGVLGILLGDSIPFYVGRRYGLGVLRHRFFARILTPQRIERAQEYFRRHGAKTVFAGRFVAGLRMPTFFMSATMGVRYTTFLFWDLMGALISCPTSIWLAYKFGPHAEELLEKSKVYVFGAIGLIAIYIVYHIISHREKPSASPATPSPSLAGQATTPKDKSTTERVEAQ